MPKLMWRDAEDIGYELYESRPDTHPLSVRFSDLRQWILALEEFADDPAASSEGTLEQIQMAWWEEWREEHGDALPP